MKSAIELHDSMCLAIELDSRGNGTAILDAYVHRSEGEPGISAGDGGIQRVRISLEMMTIAGEIGSLPTYIYDGSLVLDDAKLNNLVPLPLQIGGSATLSLMLADDARSISISGKSISVEPEGDFRFVEHVDFSHS